MKNDCKVINKRLDAIIVFQIALYEINHARETSRILVLIPSSSGKSQERVNIIGYIERSPIAKKRPYYTQICHPSKEPNGLDDKSILEKN